MRVLRELRCWCFLLLTGCLPYLTGCSESPERIEHNNPQQYLLTSNVLWASLGGVDLTMDIYTPKGAGETLPVLVMFHGGGWLVNDNSIMRQAAAYLATNGRYVVCNVNYRLLGDQDNNVMLNEIVEDAMGAVLWVKDHIAEYGGDPARLAVTGDSAGAHLSAMILNSGEQLSSKGFKAASPGFNPSYLPKGEMAEAVALRNGLRVQAAILSYGAFDIYQMALDGYEGWRNPFWLMGGAMPRGFLGEGYTAAENPELYKALSPSHTIPSATQRTLPPQLLTVGTQDDLTTPETVRAYAVDLQQAGHTAVKVWEHQGRPHAFLDSGSNRLLGIRFEEDAPPALDVMLAFLDSLFYP